MKKTPVLTFLLGLTLGAGGTFYALNSDHQGASSSGSAIDPLAATVIIEKPAIPVGEVSPETVATEVDNSTREPEQVPDSPISQMEDFERSIASEEEATQAPMEEDPVEHKEGPDPSYEAPLEEPK